MAKRMKMNKFPCKNINIQYLTLTIIKNFNLYYFRMDAMIYKVL